MTPPATWADYRAMRWVGLYTRGVPDAAARRRRHELASDLFEHRAIVGESRSQQWQVLGRVLWGIPADLLWRRAAKAPRQRRLETGANMTLRKTTTVVLVLLAVLEVMVGFNAITAEGGGWQYGVPILAAAGLIALGLIQRDAAPRRSTVLCIVAATIPTVILHWMAPIFIPLWLGVSALAIVSEPGRHRPQPTIT